MSKATTCKSLPRVYDLAEALGEHLFAKISEVYQDLKLEEISKITGILLECPKNDILWMLENVDALKNRVGAARKSLNPLNQNGVIHTELNNHVSDTTVTLETDKSEVSTHIKQQKYMISHQDKCDENLADILFQKVEHLEPDMCPKITGMLLELDEGMIKDLINNSDKLLQAVHKAKSVCDPDPSKYNHDEIGDIIFGVVHKYYPDQAAKISGMLLEMDVNTLVKLLEDRPTLLKTINQAAEICNSVT